MSDGVRWRGPLFRPVTTCSRLHKSSVGLMLFIVAVGMGCRDRPVVRMNDVVADKATQARDLDPRVLRMAVAAMISPEATHDLYSPLLDLVATRVDRRAVLIQRRTYAEVNSMMETGEIDLALVCAGPYVRGHENFGMELLVVPVVGGRSVYRSYIICRSDEEIQDLEGFRGRSFAFTDPDSNSGCLVPTYLLAKKGETPGEFFSKVIYTHGHDASVRAVAEGLVDGAAVDSLVYDSLEASGSTDSSRTSIVIRSQPFGIPPVVVDPGMNPELKESLREVFLNLHENQQAMDLMRALRIDRFVVGDDRDYDTVRAMRQALTGAEGSVQ